MKDPLEKTEPKNEELVKKKEMKPKEKCPLSDDLYDNGKEYMEC